MSTVPNTLVFVIRATAHLREHWQGMNSDKV